MFSLDSLDAGDAGAGGRRFAADARRGGGAGSATAAACSISARELARYFRNLLVVKIAGSDTRLMAASPREQERLARDRRRSFSEEDLTRYLQMTLDLFRDLQSSLQPRLHLEMGLLRLVHAGSLQSIEEALAAFGRLARARIGEAPPPRRAPPNACRQLAPRPALRSASAAARGSRPTARTAICAIATACRAARSQAHAFIADALEHSEVAESHGELRIHDAEDVSAGPEASRNSKPPCKQRRRAGRCESRSRSAKRRASRQPPRSRAETRRRSHASALWRIRKCSAFRNCSRTAQVRTVRNLKE